MGEDHAVGGRAVDFPGEILAGRWAIGFGAALILLLAAVEGAHGYAIRQNAVVGQVIQQPVPVTTPATHPDVSAPDPGDNP